MDGRQLLAGYIERETSQTKFAHAAKCSESHLSNFLAGKAEISIAMAKRMSAATDGEVPVKALVSAEISELFEAAE